MTDESVIISLVKLELKKLKLGGFNLRDNLDEEIMISNLPLLFADGYPTCLEKVTLRQLERFVPFMLQCSLGQKFLDKYTPPPKWWPQDLPFSIHVKKPVGMHDTRWFAMLKSMVCRCYTHHGCEFMLRFCTELSKAPTTTYVFFKSLDGTTSLYNKETGQLMVTFRNENREYDKEVESSPRRLLPRKNASHIPVQPPVFDIYLCDNCDGEFDTLTEVQEHERTCGKHQISEEVIPEEQPQQDSQDSFLCYFSLKPVNSDDVPRVTSPLKKNRCKGRYPMGVRLSRCCSIPFSSPLGIAIQKRYRTTAVNSQVPLERMERYCTTKTVGPSFKSREREFEDGAQDAIEWPITWKPPHRKKAKDTWTHHYCFTVKESREKMATIASRGLSKRSRNLLSICQDVRVVVTRLTEDEIIELTTRVPKPEPLPRDSGSTFQLPTLLPNTMYAYSTYLNNQNRYPEPVALSPQATIPVIDLCSSDEEDEVACVTSAPLLSDENDPLMLAGDEYLKQSRSGEKEVGPVFCDRNSTQNVAVYPLVATSCAQMGTSSSCLNGDTFTVQYSSNPSLRVSESFPQDWQMSVCMKPVPSSPAPVVTSEERLVVCSAAPLYDSEVTALPHLSNSERKTAIPTKNFNMTSLSEEGLDCVVIEKVHSPMVQCHAADYLTLYNSHVSPDRTRIHTEMKTRLSVPSCASTSLNSNSEDTKSPIQRPPFLAERRSCR